MLLRWKMMFGCLIMRRHTVILLYKVGRERQSTVQLNEIVGGITGNHDEIVSDVSNVVCITEILR